MDTDMSTAEICEKMQSKFKKEMKAILKAHKKLHNHHPCHLMPFEHKLGCAEEYPKMFDKCMEKDSSKGKMKKCIRKECVKKLEKEEVMLPMSNEDICNAMEKQSRKYQKKINKN